MPQDEAIQAPDQPREMAALERSIEQKLDRLQATVNKQSETLERIERLIRRQLLRAA